jgi:cardiolipin synthase
MILTTLESLIAAAFFLLSLMCVGTVVFFERKNPASSLAWVMVLVFLPVLGFVAYLFVGNGFRISRKRKYQSKALSDAVYNNLIRQHLNIADALKFIETHQDMARLLTCLHHEGNAIYTCDNQVEVFTRGEDMFPRMIEDIKNARDHVHLLYFIFNTDRLGCEIAEILTAKARSGVEVRIIYDSVGSRRIGWRPRIFQKLRGAGGRVLAFSPIFSNLGANLRLNYRNHRKITVIDGRIGYVGGMNIGDEYMSRNPGLSPWRDTQLRLTGSAVWFLQERFLKDWGYAGDFELKKGQDLARFFPQSQGRGRVGIQIVSSGPDTIENSPIKSGLLTIINSARRNVYLQSPYFSPDAGFFEALRLAARADVDVRLMLPGLSDHWLVTKGSLGYARQALAHGVRVFLYQGFLHSKAVVADAQVCSIGSTNLNNRSFTLDFEVNAFIYDSVFAAAYEKIFLADQEKSIELTDAWFRRQGRASQAVYNFARLFTPLT